MIEIEHLEALDQILDRHLPQMREHNERKATELAVERSRQLILDGRLDERDAEAYKEKYKLDRLKAYEFREWRSVSLYLKRGHEIQAQRFAEAASQPVGDDEVVVGFSVVARVGEIRAKLTAGGRWHEAMSLDVEPNDDEVAQGLFGALSNWASALEAPRWQQKWSDLKSFGGLLLFLLLLIGFLMIPLTNWGEAGKAAVKQEARKLLADGGVTPANEQRAVGLLLAIESEYSPQGAHAPPLGIKYWAYVSLGAITLLCVSIFPTLCIGLWKGRR
ncbi:MAG TPA: hypothetical protein VGF20_00435, partial [Candidatus Acidoferrum sp.]